MMIKKNISLALLVVSFSTTLNAQTITTIIGNGTSPSTGDGGLASAATCWDPESVTVDQNGNVYFVAPQENKIRKIQASSNIVTTIAGTGVGGFSGDGGSASTAMIDDPQGVDVDLAGNIYICDKDNYRLRKIDAATNIIVTIAGIGTPTTSGDNGTATLAAVRPRNIAVDNAGNVYFYDVGATIRKVNASDGKIYRIAGDGSGMPGTSGDGGLATSAQINVGFAGICVNRVTGDVFFADPNYHRIRKINASTGIITTIAGNGVLGFSGDGGPPLNAQFDLGFAGLRLDASGNLIVSDWGNNCVRKIDFALNLVTRVAGTGVDASTGDGGDPLLATFKGPQGLAFDPSGNLLIGDENANRIRKITFSPSGIEDFSENQIKVYYDYSTASIVTKGSGNLSNFTISLYNPIGQLIQHNQITDSVQKTDVAKCSPGLYIAVFQNQKGQQFSKKILIQ